MSLKRNWIAWTVAPALLLGGAFAARSSEDNSEDEKDAKQSADDVEWPESFVRESSLPEGFPPPSPIGEVVEKTYPPARTYWAKGTLNTAFWKCFLHLKEHKHEMTTPVVWDYRHRKEPAPKLLERFTDPVLVDRLHFVLEKPTMDELGEDGPVTVDDMPKMTVLSVAYQGELTAEAVRECEAKLQAELERRDDLEAAGDGRILGYNSPMLPEAKRYWEVQIPVHPAK